MSAKPAANLRATTLPSYTYPEFIIDESSGQVKVNLIDKVSGRVVRHIPPTELSLIVKGLFPTNKKNSR